MFPQPPFNFTSFTETSHIESSQTHDEQADWCVLMFLFKWSRLSFFIFFRGNSALFVSMQFMLHFLQYSSHTDPYTYNINILHYITQLNVYINRCIGTQKMKENTSNYFLKNQPFLLVGTDEYDNKGTI